MRDTVCRTARRTLTWAAVAALVVAFAAANSAWASVDGHIWQGIPQAGSAGASANMSSSLANATFTSAGVNFCSNFTDAACSVSGAYTPNGFVNANLPPTTFNNQMNGFNATASLNNTEVQLTGTIYLDGMADSFQIAHDDGITLALSGGPGTVTCSTQSGALCVSAPGPTAPALTPFTITASTAGLYNFTLDYAECCGPPAVLQWVYPSGAPVGAGEPSVLLLTGLALLGLGWAGRRRLLPGRG